MARWARKRASWSWPPSGSQPRYATTNSAEMIDDRAAVNATLCSERKKAAREPASISATAQKNAPQNPATSKPINAFRP